MALVDSAKQTAAEVRGVLLGTDMLHGQNGRPRHRFFVTDEPKQFSRMGHQFLGRVVGSVERVNGH